jgi:hypothetical protein
VSAISLISIILCLFVSVYHTINKAACGNSVIDPLVFATNRMIPLGIVCIIPSVIYLQSKRSENTKKAFLLFLLILLFGALTVGYGHWFFKSHLGSQSFFRLVWWIPFA